MARKRIFVVEDEEEIQELIRYNLTKEGYLVFCTDSGEEALRRIPRDLPDLVVLDLMLPGVDGLEVCKSLKSGPETRDIPIIILTAKSEEADIVTGLEIGSDDYITKPFSPRVLTARIRAALRRQGAAPTDEMSVIRTHNMLIHPGRHEVLVDDAPVHLTPTEFRVLHTLALRPGWVFTRGQIADAVHGGELVVTERSVDVHIVGLRRKLGEASQWIETVRGVGYRFKE
jgi:two-component system, OmpR family, alkaline phosphatase synthesis response regulator PhoP